VLVCKLELLFITIQKLGLIYYMHLINVCKDKETDRNFKAMIHKLLEINTLNFLKRKVCLQMYFECPFNDRSDAG
jgi:hypothetical protein